jgi:membrane complex biogenesis BtpA family protein
MEWIKEVFNVEKPIIAMCHLHALPGDPKYDPARGLSWVLDKAREDLMALQEGGVDAIMFSNENSLPYLTTTEPITAISMARIIAELLPDIRVPFGVNVLWDPIASIDLAMAVGGRFVREIFTGAYASDFGVWAPDCGKIVRHQHQIGAGKVKLLFNIVPEAALYLAPRNIADIARSTVFNAEPDGICVSGLTAGSKTDGQTLSMVKNAVPQVPVFANTGVSLENVEEQLKIADGAIVGTTFKRDGYIWNQVDVERVKAFMSCIKELRKH